MFFFLPDLHSLILKMIFIAIYFISIHWGLELFGGFFPLVRLLFALLPNSPDRCTLTRLLLSHGFFSGFFFIIFFLAYIFARNLLCLCGFLIFFLNQPLSDKILYVCVCVWLSRVVYFRFFCGYFRSFLFLLFSKLWRKRKKNIFWFVFRWLSLTKKKYMSCYIPETDDWVPVLLNVSNVV